MAKYVVKFGNSALDLEVKVNKFLAKGYKLVGGMSVISHGLSSSTYYQAMIREETDD